MARPWQARLYVFSGLHEKPQVRAMADTLGVRVDEVVGTLMRVWLAFQVKATAAGLLEGKSETWLDLLAGRPGFAGAMVKSGWLLVGPTGLELPAFDEFVSKKAVKRIENAHRMAGLREAEAGGRAGSMTHIPPHTATPGHKVPVAPAPPPTPVPKAPAKPRKPPAPKQADVTDVRFWRFWRAYPKKWNQPTTYEQWERLSPDDALVEVIVAAVEAQKQSTQWRKDNGDFIPNPVNWLAGRQWENRTEPLGGGPVYRPGRVESKPGEFTRNRTGAAVPPPPAPEPRQGGSSSLFE